MDTPIDTGSGLGLAAAALFGLVFGFLLHRGRVANFNVIVNFFRLRDWTVLKVMLTAIVVGGAGVALLHAGGLATYHIKALPLVGVLLGGALFGVGMAIYGYCPGTGIAAIGTGSVHALVGFFGMLAGGAVYGVTYPWWSETVLGIADFGKLRLPDVTPIPEPVWWVLLAVLLGSLAWVFHKRERTSGAG